MKLYLKEESMEIVSENDVEKVYLKKILNNSLSIQEMNCDTVTKHYGLKIIKREIAYAKPAKE